MPLTGYSKSVSFPSLPMPSTGFGASAEPSMRSPSTWSFLAVGDLKVPDFEIEVGAMDYGFPADGILGLDCLLRAGAFIDLRHLELGLSVPPQVSS